MVDPLELRGVPVVARGVGGAAPGTDPLQALLEREAQRERRHFLDGRAYQPGADPGARPLAPGTWIHSPPVTSQHPPRRTNVNVGPA